MNRTFRIGLSLCILLAFGVLIGCSADDPATAPAPQPEPNIAGSIGVYADNAGTNRDIVDTGGAVTVYVVHKIENGAIASAFSVEAPAGWTLVSEVSQFPVSIGNIAAGVSIGYGDCLTGVIHLMTMTYDSPGNTMAGSTFKVVPHPDPRMSGEIEVADCEQNKLLDCVGMASPVVQP